MFGWDILEVAAAVAVITGVVELLAKLQKRFRKPPDDPVTPLRE
jgi:hypothetical protein